MSSSIEHTIEEFKNINIEIKRHQNILKDLREQKTIAESIILNYLDTVGQLGITYKNMTVKTKQLKRCNQRKKSDKYQIAKNVLSQQGINMSTEQLDNFFMKIKGDPTKNFTLEILEES
jgi:hypothetical protein